MSKKYQQEIDNFIGRFGEYRGSRIVLYGIGRYTATLLEGLEGFDIVGLMDKDPANIGKMISGVSIIDMETAEKTADMVIINTAETYWDVIYERIKNMTIPIYYINGEKAEPRKNKNTVNPYKDLSCEKMLEEIEKAEIVSFDFFDTLFMRSVCNPQDVFRIMEAQLGIPFMQMRDEAKKNLKKNYSLDELYAQMPGELSGVKEKEIELEKKLLVPRRPIISCLKSLIEKGREVYIISDMYMPKKFYMDVFDMYGIQIPDSAVIVSNELDASKSDGSLWKYYSENIVNGRNALHIGDNIDADVKKPLEYGIKTYHTPNAWDMLNASALGSIAPHICGIYDTCLMGTVIARLFENPFVLGNDNTAIDIRNNKDMGYCVFGPVIMTFMLWLVDRGREDGTKKLLFMARDGYFLKQDFEYLCNLLGEEIKFCYIGISRQLAMFASAETKRDLAEYVKMPYSGSIRELFEDRFGITVADDDEDMQISDMIEKHLPEIETQFVKTRENYLRYLEKFELDDDCAVVDIGYYGNNQRYLNKLLKTDMAGYYFNANLSDKNMNTKIQKMTACFQREDDITGADSHVLRKQIYLESFLTAPYGMVKAVDESGYFVCAPDGKNQAYFKDKEEINEGVRQFMADYMEKFGELGVKYDAEFADRYYGCFFGGAAVLSDEVKKSFYNDNAMMHRREANLFY